MTSLDPRLPTTRRGLLFLGSAALLAACSSTLPATVLPQPVARSPEALTRAQILAAINGVRRSHGSGDWTYDDRLENAARSQARLMAQKDTMSHDLGVT